MSTPPEADRNHQLVAQIAPQRSTQYADLAATLALPELQLSPLGPLIAAAEALTLAGQPYVRLTLTRAPDAAEQAALGRLAFTTGFYDYFATLDGRDGPFLRPLDTGWAPFFPPELMLSRRYRGKTNEQFTHFLCNVAHAASDFAHRPWSTLRLLDPLMGGGTTLFAALMLGATAYGVERDLKDVQSTAAYLENFAREAQVPLTVERGRVQRVGRRWVYTLGAPDPVTCLMAQGETQDAVALIAGYRKPHLIVTDLPYGIQHHGPLEALLRGALPVWRRLLQPGGVIVFAWDATRIPRAAMIDLVEDAAVLRVLNDAPYDRLAHRVDRVIKQRDVIVATITPRVMRYAA